MNGAATRPCRHRVPSPAMPSRTAAHLDRVRAQVAELRALADKPEAQLCATAPFSKWNPSEHLDHTIKVTASIVNRLLQADAPRGARSLTFIGRLVLLCGWIPRGVGKAPERVRGTRCNSADLHASLAKLEGKLELLTAEHLDDARGGIVPHPRFGDLVPTVALRFAVIHTRHHVRIIEDILKAKR
jgi:hypothetical protein